MPSVDVDRDLMYGVYVHRDNRPPRFQRVKAPDKGDSVGNGAKPKMAGNVEWTGKLD